MITRKRIALTLFGAATLGSAALPAAAMAVPADGSVKIAEFRFRGLAGGNDEYVELRNVSANPQDLGGTVLTALASDGATSSTRTVFPATGAPTIPPRGSFLITNNSSMGPYSLSGYATPDITVTTGISDNAGVGLFKGSTAADAVVEKRIDSVAFVGAGGSQRPNYIETTGIPNTVTTTAGNTQQAFVRTESGGLPNDSNNNAADFKAVSTTGNNGTGAVALGAPGPQNLTAPFVRAQSALPITRFDPNVAVTASPNRTFTTGPAGGAPNVLRLRRTIKNTTGAALTKIRVRVNRISTLNNKTAAQVDLRAVDSTTVPAGVTGTTLETTGIAGYTEATTATTGGGGVNSNFVLPTGLAAGASINVQFEFDVYGYDAATSNQFDVGFFVEAQTDAPLS